MGCNNARVLIYPILKGSIGIKLDQVRMPNLPFPRLVIIVSSDPLILRSSGPTWSVDLRTHLSSSVLSVMGGTVAYSSWTS